MYVDNLRFFIRKKKVQTVYLETNLVFNNKTQWQETEATFLSFSVRFLHNGKMRGGRYLKTEIFGQVSG